MEDKIKQDWQSTKQALSKGSARDLKDFTSDLRRSTALDRLAARYKRFFILAFLFVPISFMLFNERIFSEFGDLSFLKIYVVCVFFACGAIDLWLYHKIREIDIYSMSVSRVALLAAKARKIHLIAVMVLFPFAIGYIAIMIRVFNDPYFFWGIITGGAIGLAIGTSQLLEFLADYRRLRDM